MKLLAAIGLIEALSQVSGFIGASRLPGGQIQPDLPEVCVSKWRNPGNQQATPGGIRVCCRRY
jgi:hypothetical protein